MVRAYLVAVVAVLGTGVLAVTVGLPLVVVFPVVLAVVAGIGLRGVSTPDGGSAEPDRRSQQRRAVLFSGVADHEAVDRTGEHVAGAPVFETDVDGRPVTAAATHTRDGRAVEMQTPLEVTRRGVGFDLRGTPEGVTVEREPAAVQSGDTGDLLAGVETTLSDVSVGHLRVDDRLGVVEHRVDDLSTGEEFRRQAAALVAVAGAVERAASETEAGTERTTTRG